MKLIDAGFGHVTREMEGRPHQHPEDHEFHFFVAGTGLFISRGAQTPAARGTLFFTRPGELHDTLPGGTRSTSLYYLRLRFSKAETALGENLRKGIPLGGLSIGEGLRPFFAEFLWKWRSREPHLLASAHHRTLAFCHELESGVGPLFSGGVNPHVRRTLEFLERNLSRTITLLELARHVKMHPSYLVRLFRSHLGLPPLAYFARLRIEAACQLLRRSDQGVAQVAESFGFCDPYHFSTVFRRQLGMSPRAYRAQFR